MNYPDASVEEFFRLKEFSRICIMLYSPIYHAIISSPQVVWTLNILK
ncbi:MAG: hypothetical protein HOC71_03855 [Candidatus Latescibacteria bacterium]|nr:hypothetical protein [Candidatus Latescibacterota bacterium]